MVRGVTQYVQAYIQTLSCSASNNGVQNQKPAGADTSKVARPKVGAVPYGGAGIYDCLNAGEIAVTFDDGPYLYTNDLLDKFKVCS